ncbi:YqzL family protein [Aquibacillus kalidii]|nr:YqzL family protein [Aquibacillus kalidii]
MTDLSWKFFSQTGNIETYLLMKELESVYEDAPEQMNQDFIKLEDTHMQ